MTATPIPRTLNMSLIGIRDMSIYRNAAERSPVHPNQRRQIRSGGDWAGDSQRAGARRPGVFRPQPRRVDNLFGSAKSLVQRLVPEARVVVGHGQMDEELLEARRCFDFVERKFDVLLATTIVENWPGAFRTPIRSSSTAPTGHLRPFAALSIARARRPVGSTGGTSTSADSAGRQSVARGEEAPGGDQGVQRPWQRIPRRSARP